MAYFFADSFDLYAQVSDMITYWDGQSNMAGYIQGFIPGRFGGQAIMFVNGTGNALVKNSGQNDTVHHIVFSVWNYSITGSANAYTHFVLCDGTNVQCSIALCPNGDIVLCSVAGNTGTVISRYVGAVTLLNTWFAFEVEVKISSTNGSWAVRRNGNVVNDFQASGLNTQNGSANVYANRIILQPVIGGGGYFYVDDFIWRSDATNVNWMGDVRSYIRRPSANVQTQWSRPVATIAQASYPVASYGGLGQNTSLDSPTAFGANTSRYSKLVSIGGSISGAMLPLLANYTGGNIKCCIFADSTTSPGVRPGTIIKAADAPLVSPNSGNNYFTFTPPVVIPQGTVYWLAICVDIASSGNIWNTCWWFATNMFQEAYNVTNVTYATFPVANPTGTAAQPQGQIFPLIIPTDNANYVTDAFQDGTLNYLYSSTVGNADLYNLTPLTATPQTIIACVTRGYFQKSDAGTRNVRIDLKSGATLSQGQQSTMFASQFSWITRNDLVDPTTGVAWTPVGVNNLQIGATVTA